MGEQLASVLAWAQSTSLLVSLAVKVRLMKKIKTPVPALGQGKEWVLGMDLVQDLGLDLAQVMAKVPDLVTVTAQAQESVEEPDLAMVLVQAMAKVLDLAVALAQGQDSATVMVPGRVKELE